MQVNKNIQRITQRIIEKSKATRSLYLQRVDDASNNGINRSSLSCGNLAHGMAACNPTDKKLLAEEKVGNLAIITSYNDMLSAHQPYESYPEKIKSVATRNGVTAQVAGGVPAMCDGVTQGQTGMELSLFSRDLIAMSTAMSLSHNMFDANICLGICDKIVPGLLIGSLSFGHLPTVFLPGGPMPTGQGNNEKAKVRQAFALGEVGRKELLASESASYHSAGTCTFYGTANSNQMLMEIMGVHIPGSSFIPPNTDLREALTAEAVEILIQQIKGEREVTPLATIMSEKTIINGMIGLLATGGSTNHAIHLIAIAKAAGICFDWQDMADLSAAVPLLCRIYPNGSADINHFQAAGGMGFLMRELAQGGYLHQDVTTIMGKGLEPYFQEPKLALNENADIFHSNSKMTNSKYKISWVPCPVESLDDSVVRPSNNPFSQEGGLKLLTGNLGRSVIKISAVADQHRIVEAPAMVFNSQAEFQQSFDAKELEKDFIAVIRFQGPKTNGMPELHKLTPLLGIQQDNGFKVAIVTDGRMSGASGKIPAAIHLVPEASDGGLIAKIHNGDLIRLDGVKGELSLLVTAEELESRTLLTINDLPEQSSAKNNSYGVGRELFEVFRQNVSSAEQGATIF